MPSAEFDRRWRRVRRPVVICGGELTLDMLDLKYHQVSRFYTAPLHVKANGGVFLLDDFGRQLVQPRELLNRWTLPLEEKVDYLTLSTGKSFAVPFESLVIFSTNLAPEELVDDAFLRRIRHKIHMAPPNAEQYLQIFRRCCEEREIAFNPEPVKELFARRYSPQKLPRASDPRDLLDTLVATCRFNRVGPVLDEQGLTDAFLKCLCDVGSGTAR